jgi:hypothetical protein
MEKGGGSLWGKLSGGDEKRTVSFVKKNLDKEGRSSVQ